MKAFRWTPLTGMLGLGDLPGGIHSSAAWGGSANGNVIVGAASTDVGTEAFIWDRRHGMRNLRTVAEANGLDLTGWRLTHALAMSANGRFIVGQGFNPERNQEAWIIRRWRRRRTVD